MFSKMKFVKAAHFDLVMQNFELNCIWSLKRSGGIHSVEIVLHISSLLIAYLYFLCSSFNDKNSIIIQHFKFVHIINGYEYQHEEKIDYISPQNPISSMVFVQRKITRVRITYNKLNEVECYANYILSPYIHKQ